jgi:RNA polymerase sigma-70 factor (ECF subfamily)
VTDAERTETFLAVRPRLLGIAYRLLGSMWDAEDVVAEAMVRWLQTTDEVREPAAYLTTVVSRLALDQLRSARVRREQYTGPWLPEPVLDEPGLFDPLETLVQRETLSLATLRLMESLTPPERAVFVLREAFGVPYAQIAEILDVTVEGARQLFHRADARVGSGRRLNVADPVEHATLLEKLTAAVTSGDLGGLESLLAEDVVAYNDGGGRTRAALQPIVGRAKVIRFIRGLLERFSLAPTVETTSVNGAPAVFLSLGGQAQLVSLGASGHRISEILVVLNPDKLSYVLRQRAAR